MKIIITESQYKLLLETTEGLDEFIDTLKNKFNLSDELVDEIKLIFEKSDCKKVLFEPLLHGLGMASYNRLIINTKLLERTLPFVLFVIFHELAHQYQFKKYGAEKMAGIYFNDVPLDEAANDMVKYEAVADEFAVRKIRELQKKGLIEKNFKPIKGYTNNPTPQMFKSMLSMYRNQFKKSGIDNIDKAAEYMYNMVKGN